MENKKFMTLISKLKRKILANILFRFSNAALRKFFAALTFLRVNDYSP